jgi:hypothetical protein
MHSELRAQVAFRLTGLRPGAGAQSSEARPLRPALASRFRDLAALRYDFPVVLLEKPEGDEFAAPLTAIVDRLLDRLQAPEGDLPRIRQAVLRLEREIRMMLAEGAKGSLRRLWDQAAQRLGSREATISADLAPATRALGADGLVLDCDAGFPGEFVLAAWNAVQRRKAERFREDVQRLMVRLGDILAAGEARSASSRSAARLREAVGSVHRDTFDFDVMSRLLGRGAAKAAFPDSRRRRIRSLLVSLESQQFFLDDAGYSFTFERCGLALRTFRARYARLRSLARAMAMARLEAEGEYDEARHDALFRQLRQSPLAAREFARFPDYLVRIREAELDAAGRAELLELLTSGIPAKVLVQSDDLLEDAAFAEGLAGVAARMDAIGGLAIGLDRVFVMQAAASHLPRMCAQALRGLQYQGPALFSVFSGVPGDSAVLPPYLNAAAAMESRAFPTFTYDPEGPLEGGSRFSIEGNPQPDRDWPVHPFQYEGVDHQRVKREVAFTIADFVAADERFARHFLSGPGGQLLPVAQWLEADEAAGLETAPAIAMVDGGDRLHEVVVDEPIVNLARRGLDRWRRLQKLAAMGLVVERPVPAEAAPVAAPAEESTAAAQPAPAPAAAPVATAPASDEAYIETPRCTTCNECTELNGRLFAYDANKQAYIADLSAGTYRDLVEAAESCQVSIIHPGKPRNPDEPGLEELLERAHPFL